MKYIKQLCQQFADQKKKAYTEAAYAQLKRDKVKDVKLKTKDAFIRSIQALDGKEARNVSAV